MSHSEFHADLSELDLPDGRRILAPDPLYAKLLWQSVSQDPFYGAAAADLSAGDVVLDIGANIGLTTLRFVAATPGIRAIAAEPAPVSHAALHANLDRHAPGCAAVRAAVGSACGTAELTYYPRSPANSTLHPDLEDSVEVSRTYLRNAGLSESARAQREPALVAKFQHISRAVVPVTTMDELMARFDVERVALVKIDVERAELEVLDGIGDATWPRIDRLVVEVHDLDHRVDRVTERLGGRGYRVDAAQDPSMAGTNIYMVNASRR
ncbi:FkbM family methyltransferase [Nocardia wallacei]|uniref:FkbM family methyltransferase n=1 Tax=Nocardia wallacei TaxID=480035 RepID=UPI002455EC6C|nr:FkbM family methyltransferase [Nocardia wallacei]